MPSLDDVRAREKLLHAIALVARVSGAVGSIAFMLFVGRHNSSRLLLLAFALWVLSPFALLTLATVASRRWSSLTRTTLYLVTVLIALASLTIYGTVAVGRPWPKPAAPFLVVPPVSSLVTALAIWMAALVSGGSSPPATSTQST